MKYPFVALTLFISCIVASAGPSHEISGNVGPNGGIKLHVEQRDGAVQRQSYKDQQAHVTSTGELGGDEYPIKREIRRQAKDNESAQFAISHNRSTSAHANLSSSRIGAQSLDLEPEHVRRNQAPRPPMGLGPERTARYVRPEATAFPSSSFQTQNLEQERLVSRHLTFWLLFGICFGGSGMGLWEREKYLIDKRQQREQKREKDQRRDKFSQQSSTVKVESLEHLLQLLKDDPRVELDLWGNNGAKGPEELYAELKLGKSELYHACDRHGSQNHYLQRRLKLLTVAIRAKTLQGERVLKQAAVHDIKNSTSTNIASFGRDVARKMRKKDKVEDEVEGVLRSELGLDGSWQRNHLIKEGETRRYFYSDERCGTGFPGLESRYQQIEIQLRVKNPENEECGVLGLPAGDDVVSDETTFMTDKQRIFVWLEPVDSSKGSSDEATIPSTQPSIRG